MKEKEFFVSYIENSLGERTKQTLKKFVLITIGLLVLGALVFSFFQKPFENSTFELSSTTKLVGTFHASVNQVRILF